LVVSVAIGATPAHGGTCGDFRIVGSPNVGERSQLSAVAAIGSSDAWAVGWSVSGGAMEELIEHWDGAIWTVSPNPNPDPAQALLLGVAGATATDVWAVGSTGDTPQSLIEHWNGTAWAVVTTPSIPGALNSSLSSISALSATDAWADGSYLDSSGDQRSLAFHWNGASWRFARTPKVSGSGHGDVLGAVAGVATDDVWAAGWFGTDRGTRPLTLHWDGARWNVVAASGVPGAFFHFVTGAWAAASNDVWAVGDSFATDYRTLTMHWDGSRWGIVPSPGLPNSVLSAVSGAGGDDVWAVGQVFGTSSPLGLHWAGQSWTVVPTPKFGNKESWLSGVAALPGGQVLAVGAYRGTADITRTLIEERCS
jgi:hypothetical protein